ncbi:MAG: hypothetical protein Q8Q92_00265 [bacterium]|nr:hypothetical protein [bacterium]
MKPEFSYLLMLSPILIVDLIILIRFSKILCQFRKTLVATILFFVLPWYFVVDPLAVKVWKIWSYDPSKILDIWIAETTVEEWIWMFLVAFLFSSLTLILAKREKIL